MIANLLDGIEVRLDTDYLEHKSELDAMADKIVYTGPIDAYFGYKLGPLEYRSVRFETETLDKSNFREMLRLIIQILRHRGLVSLNINGSSLAKMRMEMIFLRLSSVVSIVVNGNQATSRIIQLTMPRMDYCIANIRN